MSCKGTSRAMTRAGRDNHLAISSFASIAHLLGMASPSRNNTNVATATLSRVPPAERPMFIASTIKPTWLMILKIVTGARSTSRSEMRSARCNSSPLASSKPAARARPNRMNVTSMSRNSMSATNSTTARRAITAPPITVHAPEKLPSVVVLVLACLVVLLLLRGPCPIHAIFRERPADQAHR